MDLSLCSNVGLAARIGDGELLERLLANSAPLDVPDNRGWLPVHEAAFGNHCRILERLFSKTRQFDVNWHAHDGTTPLLIAAGKGYDEACKILLDNGADPNAGSLDENRPIIEAAKISLPCVKLLLERGADVNATYFNGWTALHETIYCGKLQIMNYLIEHDADVFATDSEGLSPAFVACQYGRTDCLSFLLKMCKEPKKLVNTYTNDGASCVYISVQEGYDQCLKILLRYDADVNSVTSDGIHPIVPAAKRGYTRCMKLMIPFMNVQNYQSTGDPVFVATEEGQLESLQFLIQNCFPVNRTTEYFRDFVVPVYSYLVPLFSRTYATPLCSATAKCRLDFVKLLLDNGAKAAYKNSTTVFDPFLLSILRRHTPEILREFLSHNIDVNGISTSSLFRIPDALLVSLHPLYHSQLLILLRSGLKPTLKNWCGCRSNGNRFLNELARILLPLEIRNTLKLVVQFECGLPNCCHQWQTVLGDYWPEFIDYATSPSSLAHLCRLTIRSSISPRDTLEETFVSRISLPKMLADFLLYKNE